MSRPQQKRRKPVRRPNRQSEEMNQKLRDTGVSAPLPADFDEVICCTSRKLASVHAGHAVLLEDGELLVLTSMQKAILYGLKNCRLKKKELEEKLHISGGNMYRNQEMATLMTFGLVHNARGGGYYRPDAPPPEAIHFPITNSWEAGE